MGGKLKAVASATVVIALLMVAPSLVVRFLPEVGVQAGIFLGVDVQRFIWTLAIVGVGLATLSIVKNLTGDWSPANLAASVLSSLVGLYLFLFLIGLGDPSGLGLTERTAKVGPGVRMYWDFRFAVTFYLVIMLLGIVKTFANFFYAKKEHSAT